MIVLLKETQDLKEHNSIISERAKNVNVCGLEFHEFLANIQNMNIVESIKRPTCPDTFHIPMIKYCGDVSGNILGATKLNYLTKHIDTTTPIQLHRHIPNK